MRLLKWVSLGAVVWSIYWAVAAWGLRSGLEAWFAEQTRQGWQVEHGDLQSAGFPLRHSTSVEQPLLADPGTGLAWSADWLTFNSPALWPGAQTVQFPFSPQRISYFDQSYSLVAQDMVADLQLAPGLALTLESLRLGSGSWQIREAEEPIWMAKDLELEMKQTDQPESYELSTSATGFAPGGMLRRMPQLNRDLPPRFDTLQLLAQVRFDTEWDRRAIELRRPQPRQIDLELAEAQWGEMRFKATGSLQVDELGQLDGALTLRVENWRRILEIAERSSLLPPSSRAAIERVLALFSRDSGQGDKLDSTLSFQNGQLWLGPLPLGAAPRLVLR